MSRLPSERWKTPPFETDDAVAIQALATGTANADQQVRGLKWIVESAAGVYQPSYQPGADGDRATAFAEGQRSVGLGIISLTRAPISKLRAQDASKKQTP